MSDKSIMCERIKMLRNKKNLTQKGLGEAIGVSESFISMVESKTNRKSPSRATISKMAEVLGVSTDYLLGLSNTEDLLPYSNTRREFEPIITKVEQLDEDKRVMVIKMIQSMVKSI
ncbi:helix-turn-helix domain-containing protein [Bacillus cereus]|uniref:helix-turn-helix domain-containing protein n=1 Tax=Bacillus cereus TaxID=1396 RepID=UPI003981749A